IQMSAPFPRHPNTVVLSEPIHVSPLIRAARWGALGLGIVWGAVRLCQIREYHADIREYEHAKAVAKVEEAAIRKKWNSKDEMRYLMKTVNIPFEEGVAQFGIADIYRED
uniref:ATP synthase F(0) complex subunit e, mitochondrial n=2 Tax=Strongyloides stercoralis TaxID=6248 RepID=A0AAF5D8R5_STRER